MKNDRTENDDVLDRAAEALRGTTVPAGPPAETLARTIEAMEQVVASSFANPTTTFRRIKNMKSVIKVALAASILVAAGIAFVWVCVGGHSATLAFAAVAEAIGGIRSATYDCICEIDGRKTSTSKCMFLAPSRERVETPAEAYSATFTAAEGPDGKVVTKEVPSATPKELKSEGVGGIMILDYQTGKGLVLAPKMKTAQVMDMRKLMAKRGPKPNMFEMIRQVVREGNSASGEKVETLGEKEVEGQKAVGFRIPIRGMGNMTLWADPQTALPIRIEYDKMELADGKRLRIMMNNFRFDIELDHALFSLTPPPSYSIQTLEIPMPTEDDLARTLRIVAEHNKGVFPKAIGYNKEFTEGLYGSMFPDMKKIESEMWKIRKKIEEKYGKSPEAEQATAKALMLLMVKGTFGKDSEAVEAAVMPLFDKMAEEKKEIEKKYGKEEKSPKAKKALEAIQAKWMEEYTKATMPFTQKLMLKRQAGLTFYMALTPKNDPHYVGGGVKLGTPDRAIFWYKPTGAENYRVLYADLTFKELTPDEVKSLPEGVGK
jgi:outer membrane lipoprotein-sorting protein